MLDALSYRAPQHLRESLERVLPGVAPPLDILDLGCGTGLSGEAFKDLAAGGRLDGIDLSAKMIDEARKRAIYTNFIVGDFESALAGLDRSYDLAIGADALIYSGDLAPTLAGVARRLKPGGLFLFTVEKLTGEGWEQTSANRFRHGETYVREAAVHAGFEVLDIIECPLRRESREPVAGFAVALKKS
jgi:predicted TPR repeat methyltransferase